MASLGRYLLSGTKTGGRASGRREARPRARSTFRIVFVITRADDLGGAQIHVRDLSSAIRRMGAEVLVLAGRGGALAEALRYRGVSFEPLPHLIRPISPHEDARALVGLWRRLGRFKPHLVSTHSSKAGVLGRLAAWGRRIPRIHTAHGWAFSEGLPENVRRLGTRVERMTAAVTHRIITVSDVDRDLAISHSIAPPHKIVTVHNAVLDVDERARPSHCPPVLVMVARFNSQKDHVTLFHALAGLKDLEWCLRLIGDGPQLEATRALAASSGFADRVSFMGLRRDVAQQLAEAQCFVLTSNWEGFPRSVLEAMRAGLPVVASDVGGVREAVVDGLTGFVVPPSDVSALRVRLRSLLSDPELRARQGGAGREAFEKSFSFDPFVRRTLNVYREVVDDEGREALGALM